LGPDRPAAADAGDTGDAFEEFVRGRSTHLLGGSCGYEHRRPPEAGTGCPPARPTTLPVQRQQHRRAGRGAHGVVRTFTVELGARPGGRRWSRTCGTGCVSRHLGRQRLGHSLPAVLEDSDPQLRQGILVRSDRASSILRACAAEHPGGCRPPNVEATESRRQATVAPPQARQPCLCLDHRSRASSVRLVAGLPVIKQAQPSARCSSGSLYLLGKLRQCFQSSTRSQRNP
jgi:hypothetical protein